uniref:Uncharacterized protein n=1 Tax=Timema tahoe TaxID=61484 RepID=A0A7R9IIP7_9NEOP|nr:unnamed protein product [Timema tahoe]
MTDPAGARLLYMLFFFVVSLPPPHVYYVYNFKVKRPIMSYRASRQMYEETSRRPHLLNASGIVSDELKLAGYTNSKLQPLPQRGNTGGKENKRKEASSAQVDTVDTEDELDEDEDGQLEGIESLSSLFMKMTLGSSKSQMSWQITAHHLQEESQFYQFTQRLQRWQLKYLNLMILLPSHLLLLEEVNAPENPKHVNQALEHKVIRDFIAIFAPRLGINYSEIGFYTVDDVAEVEPCMHYGEE